MVVVERNCGGRWVDDPAGVNPNPHLTGVGELDVRWRYIKRREKI